jgi:hypothetical protein
LLVGIGSTSPVALKRWLATEDNPADSQMLKDFAGQYHLVLVGKPLSSAPIKHDLAKPHGNIPREPETLDGVAVGRGRIIVDHASSYIGTKNEQWHLAELIGALNEAY